MPNTINHMFQYWLAHTAELFYTCLHNLMSIYVSCLLLLWKQFFFYILNIFITIKLYKLLRFSY
jgi:hypothetical protein